MTAGGSQPPDTSHGRRDGGEIPGQSDLGPRYSGDRSRHELLNTQEPDDIPETDNLLWI